MLIFASYFLPIRNHIYIPRWISITLCVGVEVRGFGAFKSSNENKSLPRVHSCIFNTAWTCLSRYFDPASRVIIVTLFITLVNGSEFGKSGHVDGGLSDVTASKAEKKVICINVVNCGLIIVGRKKIQLTQQHVFVYDNNM